MGEDETAPFDSCVKASSFQTLTGRNPYRRIPFEFCARILETEYAGAITMRRRERVAPGVFPGGRRSVVAPAARKLCSAHRLLIDYLLLISLRFVEIGGKKTRGEGVLVDLVPPTPPHAREWAIVSFLIFSN